MSWKLHNFVYCAIALVAAGAAAGAEPLADPTRPVTAHPTPETRFASVAVRVEAILSRAAGRIAIVNGKLVRAGDRLGNVSIEEVTADGVRYLQDGRMNFARLTAQKMLVRRNLVARKDTP